MSKVCRPLTTTSTYSLAHTAQCKLKISANRPDRNLRFVLGHAFTLDNLMLRIVEIENRSAKSDFLEGKPPSEDGFTHYDCSAAAASASAHLDPPKAEAPTTTAPAEVPSGGRRISFHDNNARPSKITPNTNTSTNSGTNSPARNRSPPPPAHSRQQYLDDSSSEDGTSSDDYDEPNSYVPTIDANTDPSTHQKHPRPQPDAYSHEEDAALELADDELDDPLADDFGSGLSLQRFESASAHPPRMVRSGSSSSSEDDDNEPVSPPQLPLDLDVRELIGGEKDQELAGLYDSVKNCGCHGQVHDPELTHEPTAFWDIPEEKTGGKRLAIFAVAAAA